MTDPFAVLGLPARPWLDPEALRSAWLHRSEELHRAGRAEEELMAVNRAHQILGNPATRIEQLLARGGEEAGAARQITPTVGALFGEVAERLQEADRLLTEVSSGASSASSALVRAVRVAQSQDLRAGLEALADRLEEEKTRRERELQRLDGEWARDPGAVRLPLARLALDLTFLQRWLGQVRERLLRLDEEGV